MPASAAPVMPSGGTSSAFSAVLSAAAASRCSAGARTWPSPCSSAALTVTSAPGAAVQAIHASVSLPAASSYSITLIGCASKASPADAARPISQNQRSAVVVCRCMPSRSFFIRSSVSAGMKSTDREEASMVTN
ncbi:hypothetical protein D3C77_504870 [compost metagenome]